MRQVRKETEIRDTECANNISRERKKKKMQDKKWLNKWDGNLSELLGDLCLDMNAPIRF